MKFKWAVVVGFMTTLIAQTATLPGLEQEHPLQLTVTPLTVRLTSDQVRPLGSLVQLQSIDPSGKAHPVRDLRGQGQWSLEALQNGQSFQIVPSPSSYAGPLQVTIDGRVVSRYGNLIPSTQNLILEKVLSAKAEDGTILKVHFTDFSLEKIQDRTYPHRVLTHMKEAYDRLTADMRLAENQDAKPRAIEAYIGDTEPGGLLPFGGFTLADFRRAPLFMVRADEKTGRKTPVLLLPADYKKFLKFWNQINHVPSESSYTADEYLATSVMHEMTHAVIHGFNENLGSTEHEARGGDWYTEGLARYFECKAGSDAGFASEGFRKVVDGRVQFSRGGANYYLRYPDESFFSMRYENALFWLYFDKRFGGSAIVRLSRELKGLSLDADNSDYSRILASVTGGSFEDLMNDYFNWVFRGGYRNYTEAAKLLPVAMTRSIWSGGNFYIYNPDGDLLALKDKLDTDWVASWGDASAAKFNENIAGDWTPEAEVQPLAFDAQQIEMSAAYGTEHRINVTNTGNSSDLRVTLYLESVNGRRTETRDLAAGQTGHVTIGATEHVTRVGGVFANLDPAKTAAYKITID